MTKVTKFFLWTICSFLTLILICFAALPTWLTTAGGTATLLKLVNSRLKGKLTVDKVELNWFGAQRLNQVKLEDEMGAVIFSCRLCETDTSLFYLLMGGRALHTTRILEPYLSLSDQEKESQKTEKEGNKSKKEFLKFSFKETLLVENGTVVFVSEQGNLKGSLSIDATVEKQAQIHMKDFPVAILDHLCESKLFTAALGPSLNLDLNIAQVNEETLLAVGSVQSDHLTGHLEGTTEKGLFTINPQSHLDFTITPAFFKQIIDEKQRGNWELASKTNLNMKIEKGQFPLTRRPDFKEIVLQATAHIDRAELHHTTVGSYSLKEFDATLTAHQNLDLVYKAEIQGKEATKLAGKASLSPEGDVSFDYTCQGFPVTLLELFSETLEQKVRTLLGSQFDLAGKGSVISKHFATEINLKSPHTELTGKITGRLPEINFEFSGQRVIHGEKTKVLGDTLNFTLNGLARSDHGHFMVPFIKGKLFNSYFDCDLRGQIGEEEKSFSWNQIQLLATGSIKALPFVEEISGKALQNGTFYVHADGAKNLITGKAESQALVAHFEVNQFIQNEMLSFDQATIDFNCALRDFPLSLVAPFIAEDLDLTQFLGKTLSLTSKGRYTPHQEPRLTLDLNAQSAGFSTSVSVTLDEGLIVKQNRPSYVYWEITPERYEALMRLFRLNPGYEPTYTLTRPTQIELNISHFTCPTAFSKNLSRFFCQSGFIGDVKIGATTFKSKQTHEAITFQEITGSIKGENFSKAIDLTLSGNILASNLPQNKHSAISFNGQMLHFWTTEGKFNREGLTVKGDLSLDLLPVRPFTGIVPLDHETRAIVQAVLGDFVNARITGEISKLTGPVTIDVKSSNFKALLPLQLEKHALFLRDYVNAEITLTEAVNETLLKDINPLLITGAYSDHPIKVYVDPQGFMLPIKPYALERVEIGKAIVDFGKIRVRNGGQIQRLIQFLNAKEITPDGLMEAWFTPIFVSLHQGVARYQRFDALLAGNVHTAMWGSVNLINDQVNMTLAIAPTTLYERFKISGLTKKDMFQVQMGGTTQHLELDWSTAYSRIAWIVARSSAGHLSSILGGILEQLVSSPNEEPAPPPTTSPLPWESLYPS